MSNRNLISAGQQRGIVSIFGRSVKIHYTSVHNALFTEKYISSLRLYVTAYRLIGFHIFLHTIKVKTVKIDLKIEKPKDSITGIRTNKDI